MVDEQVVRFDGVGLAVDHRVVWPCSILYAREAREKM